MVRILKIDARIDFFYGALVGAVPLCFGAGWFALITIPLCSIFYAMGGDDDWSSAWRDVGCAAVNSIGLILATGNLLFFGAALAVYGLLTVGLGLPSINPPDAGSIVGRFFWRLAEKHIKPNFSDEAEVTRFRIEERANIYTHIFQFGSIWLIYFVVSILRGLIW
jgi:hypothetical protein